MIIKEGPIYLEEPIYIERQYIFFKVKKLFRPIKFLDQKKIFRPKKLQEDRYLITNNVPLI